MMNTAQPGSGFRKKLKRVLWVILFLVLVLAVYLYFNFNKILSDALLKNFNSSINSNVYELSFEKLRINLVDGDVGVLNVRIVPREKPLGNYPYINSSFQFTTKRIQLKNLQIRKLIKENKFEVEKIEIVRPEIEMHMTGKFPIFFPLKDSSEVTHEKSDKRFIEDFYLEQFRLEDAAISVSNEYKKRGMNIKGFSITIDSIRFNQHAQIKEYFIGNLVIRVNSFEGQLFNGPFRKIAVKNYALDIDSLHISRTVDTLNYDFGKYLLGFNDLDLNTKDSVQNLKLASFNMDYKKKNIRLKGFSFKPNVSREEIQKKEKYENSQYEVSIGDLNIENINFDSLIYERKLFIEKISLDSVEAVIYKNGKKPVNMSNVPKYLGQSIKSIGIPLRVDLVVADHANILSLEEIPGIMGKANVNRAKAELTNITNLDESRPLVLKTEAYLENKVNFRVKLEFSYTQPQFSVDVKFRSFNMTDMNPIITSYTPGKVNSGIADEISLEGMVYQKYAEGTMKFLYHNLNVDLDLKDKALINSIGAFAANAYLDASNPPEGLPERVVKYKVETKPTSGFINAVIKSALAGLKETVWMSKENRKAYKEKKKQAKKK